MGLTQSSQQTEQTTKAETPTEETKSTNETIVQAPVESVVPTPELVTDKTIKQEPETDNPNEHYLEKQGTKVEVAPVEVAPTDDVVKKTKRKNKNKNKEKQNEKTN